jgi:hypothetical protein
MLLKIGFTYSEALAMPEGEASEYLKVWTDFKKPKSENTGKGKKYIVKKGG